MLVGLRDRQAALETPNDEGEEHATLAVEIAALTETGRRSPFPSEASVLLRGYLLRAMRQVAAIEIARLQGDFTDQITDTLFVHSDPPPGEGLGAAATSPAGSQTPLAAIVDGWAVERKVQAKGVDTHRAVVRWFEERVGPIPVENITQAYVRLFKNKLVKERVSLANTNTKLARLRTLLQYAVDNGHLAENPAKGFTLRDKDSARRKQREFDVASLNRIFASPVYSEDQWPVQGRGEAAYWLPLLALYTGARLEELAQLRTGDVELLPYFDLADREQSVWSICINHDEEDGLKTKNAGSVRTVPVHPELERLGFIRFVRAAGQQRKLFPLLKPNAYGRVGAKWGEWWSIYRRNECGVADPRLVFIHSAIPSNSTRDTWAWWRASSAR